MRVFLDSNVLISAFHFRGVAAEVYDVVLLRHELVIGVFVLDEVERILRDKIGISGEEVAAVLNKLRGDAHVEPMPLGPAAFPEDDRADAWVLATALAAGVDVLEPIRKT